MAGDTARPFDAFDLASRDSVIAAVSGGSDSVALLVLLKKHLDRFAPSTRLVAATIDHGLRAGSADEALAVGRLCSTLGIVHRVCRWSGDKPSTGLPAAAREARYRLLAEIAYAEGTDLVLTGHTADDQAETVLMRAKRDAGRGLACMAPMTLFAGHVWIVRPLLSTRRNALRDELRAAGVAWADDPTNADKVYERPRLRAQLAAESMRFAQALAIADEAANAREALGRAAAVLIGEHANRPAPGLVRLHPAILDADRDAAIYVLRMLLGVQGGTPHLPDEARSAALFDTLRQGTRRGTLSRTLVDRRRGGIFLLRELRDLPPETTIEDGRLWDGRFKIGHAGSRGFASTRLGANLDEKIPASLLRLAKAAQPRSSHAIPILAPWDRFLPSFDLAPAQAVAKLIGAAPIPLPPCQDHIARKA